MDGHRRRQYEWDRGGFRVREVPVRHEPEGRTPTGPPARLEAGERLMNFLVGTLLVAAWAGLVIAQAHIP